MLRVAHPPIRGRSRTRVPLCRENSSEFEYLRVLPFHSFFGRSLSNHPYLFLLDLILFRVKQESPCPVKRASPSLRTPLCQAWIAESPSPWTNNGPLGQIIPGPLPR